MLATANEKRGHLILERKMGESLTFTVGGTEFEIILNRPKNGNRARVAVSIIAPAAVRVMRSELLLVTEG